MWDGGRFRVCDGDFVELGKNKRRKEGYDLGSQPGSLPLPPMIQYMRLKSIPKANNFINLIQSIIQ